MKTRGWNYKRQFLPLKSWRSDFGKSQIKVNSNRFVWRTWRLSPAKLGVMLLSWTIVLWSLSQNNNIDACRSTSVLSDSSVGCAGWRKHLLWFADGSTANKGVSTVTSSVSSASHAWTSKATLPWQCRKSKISLGPKVETRTSECNL